MVRRLRISGRVQGVWFRAWTQGEARALRLRGWVRNRSDGTVEIVASGSETSLAALAQRCCEGPPTARVARVEVESAPDAPDSLPFPFETRPCG